MAATQSSETTSELPCAGTLICVVPASVISIGVVTSGGFGPSVNAPVAMGYVPATHPADGSRLFAEVRGQRLAVRVKDLPFVPHNYKR